MEKMKLNSIFSSVHIKDCFTAWGVSKLFGAKSHKSHILQ